MPDVHMKGYMLKLIARNEAMWDDEVADAVLTAYGHSGDYWRGTVRLTLTDLFSSGLIEEREIRVDDEGGKPTLRFKFAVNSFGVERMAQTRLLEAIR